MNTIFDKKSFDEKLSYIYDTEQLMFELFKNEVKKEDPSLKDYVIEKMFDLNRLLYKEDLIKIERPFVKTKDDIKDFHHYILNWIYNELLDFGLQKEWLKCISYSYDEINGDHYYKFFIDSEIMDDEYGDLYLCITSYFEDYRYELLIEYLKVLQIDVDYCFYYEGESNLNDIINVTDCIIGYKG